MFVEGEPGTCWDQLMQPSGDFGAAPAREPVAGGEVTAPAPGKQERGTGGVRAGGEGTAEHPWLPPYL